MKNLRRTLATLTLIFALVAPVMAGDMHAGSPAPPPSDPATTQTTTTTTAPTAPTDDAQASTADSDLASAVANAALSLVQALVSLL
jgi:hypothetical protein